MGNIMNLFDLEISKELSKDLVRKIAENLGEGRIYTVGVVILETLLREKDNEEWKKQMQMMDLLIPGGKDILSTEEYKNRSLEKEIENDTFPKLFIRYLQKNKKTLYLLAASEEGLLLFEEGLKTYGPHIKIIGRSVLSETGQGRENVINEINGIEPDCIFSALPSPLQEDFIAENKALLNSRIWVGCSSKALDIKKKKKARKLQHFILKKILRYQIEKQSD